MVILGPLEHPSPRRSGRGAAAVDGLFPPQCVGLLSFTEREVSACSGDLDSAIKSCCHPYKPGSQSLHVSGPHNAQRTARPGPPSGQGQWNHNSEQPEDRSPWPLSELSGCFGPQSVIFLNKKTDLDSA